MDESASDRFRQSPLLSRARAKLGQMIITDARLDGVKTAVIIDTGAQNSVGNKALLRKLRSRSDHTFSSTDVHGTTMKGRLSYAKRLQIGPIQLSQIPIGFADSPALDALGYADRPAVILGMGNLRLFDRVAIDFSTPKVMFDLPADVMRRGPFNFGKRASRIRS